MACSGNRARRSLAPPSSRAYLWGTCFIGCPRQRCTLLLGWPQLPERKEDESVVDDLYAASEEERKAEGGDAECPAGHSRGEGRGRVARDIRQSGGRGPLVGIDDRHCVRLPRRH